MVSISVPIHWRICLDRLNLISDRRGLGNAILNNRFEESSIIRVPGTSWFPLLHELSSDSI
jgi:hypothetical protein